MPRPVRALALFLPALVLLLGAVPRAAEASLIGDPVTCEWNESNLDCNPAGATVGAGPEFDGRATGFAILTADVAAASITLTNPQPTVLTLDTPTPMIFGDLDSSAGDIVGVSIAALSGVIGIDTGDLSFTAHSVSINPSGAWQPGSTAVISLLFENATAVAAPATLLLVGSAGAGLGAARAWRRRQVR